MNSDSSTAKKSLRDKTIMGVAVIMFIFVVTAIFGLVPDRLKSDHAIANKFCQRQGFDQAYKWGRDMHKTVIVKCNTLHYNKTENGTTIVWQDDQTFYNPDLYGDQNATKRP